MFYKLFRIMQFVCILGEVNISYIFSFTFGDLLTFTKSVELNRLISKNTAIYLGISLKLPSQLPLIWQKVHYLGHTYITDSNLIIY